MSQILLRLIKNHIRANGPLSIADYMDYCLLHPEYGYYTQSEAIGTKGDFTTAPEISQCFGEMVGLWCLDMIMQIREQDANTPIHLIELGPGRGVLMQDVLRTLEKGKVNKENLYVTLVEASQKLEKTQHNALIDFDFQIDWQANIDFEPKGKVIYIANEFFDALPIHQYILTQEGAHETRIALDKNDKLCYSLLPLGIENQDITMAFLSLVQSQKAASNKEINTENLRYVIEKSPISEIIMGKIGENIAANGGAGLVIDYGYENTPPKAGSFQALKNHAYANPLVNPGEQDVTAHVCFGALYQALQNKDVALYPLLTQSDFLKAMGIEYRLEQLISQNPAHQERLLLGVSRLIDQDEMGHLFKVMQVSDKSLLPSIYKGK